MTCDILIYDLLPHDEVDDMEKNTETIIDPILILPFIKKKKATCFTHRETRKPQKPRTALAITSHGKQQLLVKAKRLCIRF